MITRISEIISLLKKQDYRCAGQLDVYTEVLWKSENGINKGVIVADAIFLHISSKQGVEYIIRAAKAEYPFLHEVLVILIGDGKKMKMRVENLVCIDCSCSKVRICRVGKAFQAEQTFISLFTKQKDKMEMERQYAYGIQRKEYYSWIVWVIVALNLYMFVRTLGNASYEWGISADNVYSNHQGYRLISYMFVHSGIRHIWSNMVSLIVIGRILVKRIGSFDFAVVYLVGGMIGGIASMTYSMYMLKDTSISTVGASGAIFAVLGALVCDILMDETMRDKRKYYIKYAAITLVLSSIGYNIDIMCHVGGFVGGVAIMYFMNICDVIRNDRSYIKQCCM